MLITLEDFEKVDFYVDAIIGAYSFLNSKTNIKNSD
jgi:hypothetical protein